MSPSRRSPARRQLLNLLLLEDRSVPSVDLTHALSDLPPRFFLTSPDGFLSGPRQEGAVTLAHAALQTHATAAGLLPGDVANPDVTAAYSESGLSHVYFRQTFNGLDVLNTSIGVHLTADGRLITINGGFVPGLSAREGGPGAVPTPQVSPSQAVAAAATAFGYTLTMAPDVVVQHSGLTRSAVLTAPELSPASIPAGLVYVYTSGAGVRLAWHVNIQTRDRLHWYDAAVDAETGQLVYAADWVDDFGTYNVFSLPARSPNDGGRSFEVNPFDPGVSPYGWHDVNGVSGAEFTDTRGNNVFAQEDMDGNDIITDTGGRRPDGGSSHLFDFPFNPAQPATANVNALVTNLFYVSNMVHDVTARFGFTEAAGNFQMWNYTGQGVGGDPVQADALDAWLVPPPGRGVNNANFATPPDGTSPRMQMYVWTTATPTRGGEFDAEVIIHEYGHGVSNRLTGGPADVNALNAVQSGGMGEGWSDFLALMLTQKPTDTKLGSYPLGAYVENDPAGIRRRPYSFDMSVNPLTFEAYGTSGTTSYGIARTTQVHATGEIWCSVLWDLNWLLIDKYGFDPDLTTGYTPGGGSAAAGNKLALQLVLDGMKLQPANPSFTDARDAILLADRVLTGGANQWEIWTAFARRGLGYGAAPFTNSSSQIIDVSFAMPPQTITAPVIVAQSPTGRGPTVPGSFTVSFSHPMNTTSFSAADVVSFTAPGGVDLRPSLTFTWLDDQTLQLNYTPPLDPATNLPVQGQYTFVLGPDIRSSIGAPLDTNLNGTAGEVLQDRYTGSFRYDATQLEVVAITPSAGGTVSTGVVEVDVTFNEPVAPGSVGLDDLQLSRGTVVDRTIVSPTQVRYRVTGLEGEGPVYMTMKYGAVADPFGFPVLKFNSSFVTEITTAPFPVPLVPTGAEGWLTYTGQFDAAVSPASDTDSFTVNLDAGNRLTVVVEEVTTLQPTVAVLDPQGGAFASAVSPAAGTPAAVNSVLITTPGTYTITVGGAGGTTGAYRLRVYLNAAAEEETVGGGSNDTRATAQPLDPALVSLPGGASIVSVVGVGDPGPDALPNEAEPNDTTGEANDATRSFAPDLTVSQYQLAITGSIAAPAQGVADTDWFTIGQLQPGDVITVAVSGSAAQGGTLANPYLELWRLGGNGTLVASDDNGGPGNDALLYRFTVSVPDVYVIRIRSATASGSGSYQVGILLENVGPPPLTPTNGPIPLPGEAFLAEIEGNDTIFNANNASRAWRPSQPTGGNATQFLSRTAGTITSGDTDVFRYTFTAGDRVTVRATGQEGLVPQVSLRNGSGAVIRSNNGTGDSSPQADLYAFVVPATGTYFVQVAGGTTTGTYRLEVVLATAPTTPPPGTTTSADFYSIDLAAGERLSVGLKRDTPGVTAFEVQDAAGQVLATGAEGAANFDLGVNGFIAPADGTYYIRVADVFTTRYTLTAVKGGFLEVEPNSAVDVVQRVVTGSAVVGAITPGDADWYTFSVATAGELVTLQTATPGDGPGQFVNTLDPALELYGPDGSLLAADDNTVADGRNARIRMSMPEAGTYSVRVAAAGSTAGPYVFTLSTSPNTPPGGVSAGGPYTISEGGSLALVATADDPDGDPLTFAWDVNGDGVYGDVFGQNPTLTWAELQSLGIVDGPATFTVSVRVSDAFSPAPVTSTPVTLTVANAAPTGTPTNDGPVVEGNSTTVSLTDVTDPSAPDTAAGFRYSYDFDNNGVWEVGDGTYAGSVAAATATVPASFLADGPSTQVVRIRVVDRDGGFTDYTTSIQVLNTGPVATLTNNGPVAAGVPVTITFVNPTDPSGADQAAGFLFSYDFDNDGDFTSPGDIADSPLPSAQTSFGATGAYVVRGRVADQKGGFNDFFTTVLVQNGPPTATLSNSGPVPEGGTATVSLTNVSHPSPVSTAAGFRYSYDFDGDGNWEVGDGTYAGSPAVPSVTVPAGLTADGPRTLPVRVRVLEVSGSFLELTTDLVVQNVAPTATPVGPVGRVEQGASFTVSLVGVSDPSAADRAAGFRYSFDADNDGNFTGPADVQDSLSSTATFNLPNGRHQIRARVTDKDGGFTEYVVPVVVGVATKRWYAAGSGASPEVTLFDSTGAARFTRTVFGDPLFTGGVRTAVGDVNGDGIPDVVVGTGPGVPTQVQVLDGRTGAVLFSTSPFEAGFTGGVFVAAGDVNGDGFADFAVSPDEGGGPRVLVYDGRSFTLMANFFGIEDPNFRGGARVAMADLDGDGVADLLVAAGTGGGPRVAAYNGTSLASGSPVRLFNDIFVFEQTLRDGVYVAGGDLDGDGFAELIVGAGPGGAPRVFALSGEGLLNGREVVKANFFVGEPGTRDGVRVTVAELDGDGRAEIVTGSGSRPRVTVFAGSSIGPAGQPRELFSFEAFDTIVGGVFVG